MIRRISRFLQGFLLTLALLTLALVRGDVLSSESLLGYRLAPLVRGRVYNFMAWEVDALGGSLGRAIRACPQDIAADSDLLRQYLRAAAQAHQAKTALEKEANPAPGLKERLGVLEAQARGLEGPATRVVECLVIEALAEEGITIGVPLYPRVFPPVLFVFEHPPLALIISPREGIEMARQIYLAPRMTLAEQEKLEEAVDALGVSSLVVGVGGLSTYPTMVLSEAPLSFLVSTVAHEWFHVYFIFRPLGQNYGQSRELTTMNETVASLAGDEIGERVLARYFPEELPLVRGELLPQDKTREDFFSEEMRRIRLKVDELLAEGEVEEAEDFMEESRKFLEEKGYPLRKLNQAYFAFYGSYATSPESVDPIGQELRELRSQKASLKEFVEAISRMSSYEDLTQALKR